MSDGNFNKSLLPHGGYSSGVRAGEARMKSRALQAFAEMFSETMPDATEEERQEKILRFRELLNK